jgi:hypothetical protein
MTKTLALALVLCAIALLALHSSPRQYVISAEDDAVPCAVKQAPDGIERVNGVLIATCAK